MDLALAFRLGAIWLTFVAAILAIRAAMVISKDVALAIVTFWGGGTITSKFVLQQKGDSLASFTAIVCALLFQIVGEVHQLERLEPMWAPVVVVVALALGMGIFVLAEIQGRRLGEPLLRLIAQGSRDAAEAQSANERWLHVLGAVYGVKRRRKENLESYRARLIERINALAALQTPHPFQG